jgi:hypothetical protein
MAFALADPASRDAALLETLPGGVSSVRISASGAGSGTVLAEIYEIPPTSGVTLATPRLVNVSVLKTLGSGLVIGFVVTGPGPRTVLIRAVGPTLAAAPFNLSGTAADPQLALYSGATRTSENNDWGATAALTTAFSQAGAFMLPAGSRDAALIATLLPGNYSVQVTSVGATSGSALVELYEMP